jgi:anti-sigma regulatory factor (Ser/Thr protein kinase)
MVWMDSVELNLPRVPVSVARARAGLRPLRDALGHRYQDAVLLVSEVVTNAVRHGHGTTVALSAVVRDATLRIEIVDGGVGFEPPAGEPDPSSPGGRGLRIVNSLADRWGVYEGNSTHVWFEMELG